MPRISNKEKYQNIIDNMTRGERREFFKTIRLNASHLSRQYPGRQKTLEKLSRLAYAHKDGEHVADYHDYVAQMKRQLKARKQDLDDPHNI